MSSCQIQEHSQLEGVVAMRSDPQLDDTSCWHGEAKLEQKE